MFSSAVQGDDFLEDPGIEKGKKYLVAMMIFVGDTNAVDLCQEIHLQCLRQASCVRPNETLRYRHPFPTPQSDCLEGLYIDDHICIQVVKEELKRKRVQLRDDVIMRDSREHYTVINMPRALEKAFAKQSDFVSWGAAVSNCTGRVGTPLAKLHAIATATIRFLKLPFVTKKACQQLIGQYPHPFGHRREAMACFQVA